MDLYLPKDMMALSALEFCQTLERLDYSKIDEIAYRLQNFGTVEPFGMLLVGAKIREIKRRHINIKYKYYPVDSPHPYAGHMGFFRSIGIRYGKEPGEAPGSSTYAPISKLSVDKIKRDAIEQRKHVGEIVEAHAFSLAKILHTGAKESIGHMTFSIREIMRNVVEHSKSQTIWYAGQAWASKGIVEIAILDEGIGIQQTINSNAYYAKHSYDNLESLKFALEPGITKTFSPKRQNGDQDDWINTGFGLYMTSNICKKIGNFVICSGGHALLKCNDVEDIRETSFNGTAIRMRLRLSELSSVTELRKNLVNEGEKQARQNAKLAVKVASTASKLSYMNKNIDS